MCVWITAESVFQCLGTDTFCPTSAPSLVSGNILGDNTLDDAGTFSANACVSSCFDCVNCASTQLSSFFYVILWFGLYKMVSCEFQERSLGQWLNSC